MENGLMFRVRCERGSAVILLDEKGPYTWEKAKLAAIRYFSELDWPNTLTTKARELDCWTEDEKAMFAAGDAIRRYVRSGPWPTVTELEDKVWRVELQGTITRDDFRQVCRNLRNGFSDLGDC